MSKFDIETMRAQSRAGMTRWYLHFVSEVQTTEGLTGPFDSEEAAQKAVNALMHADKLMAQADADSPWFVGHYLFYRVQVIEATPHEIDCLVNPEREGAE